MSNALLFSLLAITAGTAFAGEVGGTKDGGGGKGVLCGDRLRTLDLYEATEVHHLALGPDRGFEGDLAAYGLELVRYVSRSAFDPAAPGNREQVMAYLKSRVIDRIRDIPVGSHLPLTDDATLPALPPGCSIAQIMVYSDRDAVISRDPVLWGRLDAFDQAALLLHEAYYHEAIRTQARDRASVRSDDARRVIGEVMSTTPREPIHYPLWNATKRFECGAGGGAGIPPQEVFDVAFFDTVEQGVSGLGIDLEIVKGQHMAFRTTAFAPGYALDRFAEDDAAGPIYATAVKQVTGETWTLEIIPGRVTLDGRVLRRVWIHAWASGESAPPVSSGICDYF